jgi:hypothetical protein
MALDLRWSKPSVSQGYLLVCGWLVVWNMNYFFHSVENFIIPTGGLIFFRGVGEKPPSRKHVSFDPLPSCMGLFHFQLLEFA